MLNSELFGIFTKLAYIIKIISLIFFYYFVCSQYRIIELLFKNLGQEIIKAVDGYAVYKIFRVLNNFLILLHNCILPYNVIMYLQITLHYCWNYCGKSCYIKIVTLNSQWTRLLWSNALINQVLGNYVNWNTLYFTYKIKLPITRILTYLMNISFIIICIYTIKEHKKVEESTRPIWRKAIEKTMAQ